MNTTYFLNVIAGNVFGTQTSPALPTEYYLGLSTSAPTVLGTNVSEPAAAEYGRIKIDNFSVPEDGSVKTSTVLAFPESTSSWGTVTYYVIYDSAEGGNLLVFCPLSQAKTIEANTIATFKAGEIEMILTNES